MGIGTAVVRLRAAETQQSPVNQVHPATGTLDDADAFQGVGECPVTRAGFGGQQVGKGYALHQTAGVADGQSVVVQAHMHRAQAGVVAMLNRIGNGFTKGRDIHPRHRDAEQTHLQLSLRVVRTEVGFQPVQRFQQRIAAEFVEAYLFPFQHLKSQFMGGNPLAQRRFPAQQQQPQQGWHPVTVGGAECQAQRPIQRFVVEF